ncbi:flagellar basal body-associated protein FliL [Natranaerovirga hydrolytica]|uniref:Flagellar protein FliL n=1 Tax=Natranaerovirga hydrolytica TaxID=680378 RepID=A0A4R1MZ65_9FIRM|nr:flagellar basal body-associated FliL family protein [Natranaerovirga hydrolytica]TCK97900.1 flagellar basal body-associated protein FliL [Natranaerovirga hydrolytica]
MDKNKIILPIGIAILFVNLILLILLIVLALPPLTSVNKIVTTMEQVLELEYIHNGEANQNVPISELKTVSIDGQTSVNIRSMTTNNNHVLRLSVGFAINENANDVEDVIQELQEKEEYILSQVASVARRKTYEDIITEDGVDELTSEIVTHINQLLRTNAIVDVIYKDFMYN